MEEIIIISLVEHFDIIESIDFSKEKLRLWMRSIKVGVVA